MLDFLGDKFDAVQQELDRLLPLVWDALGGEVVGEDTATEDLDLTPEMLGQIKTSPGHA